MIEWARCTALSRGAAGWHLSSAINTLDELWPQDVTSPHGRLPLLRGSWRESGRRGLLHVALACARGKQGGSPDPTGSHKQQFAWHRPNCLVGRVRVVGE